MQSRFFLSPTPIKSLRQTPTFQRRHQTTTTTPKKALIPHFLRKESTIAKPNFNRWLVPPASISIHLCIGSVYAWSIFNPSLTREIGVLASSSADWGLSEVVPIFSTAIVVLGLSAAFAGHWMEKVGPRLVGVTSACCWGGGFLIASLGIWLHSLPLLYLGYGVVGGCGLGLGYISPVSTLIKWFPDKRGMATGMAIMGFGGGAMVASPAQEYLLKTFFRAPTYLGPTSEVNLITEGGRRLAEVAGEFREVVIAGTSELSKFPDLLPEGVYLAGTGNTGAAGTFLVLGLLYTSVMLVGSFSYRIPPPNWQPPGWSPGKTSGNSMITKNHVHINQSLKTRQFYLLWINLCCNVTAGIGIIGVAKTMMNDIFGTTLPHIVDITFAATYVSMISIANMVGRFFWASTSDVIGRKNTFTIFFGLGIPLYLSLPYFAQQVSISPGITPLVMFYGASMLIFTMYGGGFATIPAYLADIFGTKYVGGIHGRLLTAWSTAGILGPLTITYLQTRSTFQAIIDLSNKTDPLVFYQKFGAPLDQLTMLINAKTVTIPRLMEIVPPGTLDPTVFLYNSTMNCMAFVLGIAFLSNLLITPVHPKHFMIEKSEPSVGKENDSKKNDTEGGVNNGENK